MTLRRVVHNVCALIAAAIGGLLTVALTLGALYVAYQIFDTDSQYVTWEAVIYGVTAYVLLRGADRTGKFASRMIHLVDGIFVQDQSPLP